MASMVHLLLTLFVKHYGEHGRPTANIIRKTFVK